MPAVQCAPPVTHYCDQLSLRVVCCAGTGITWPTPMLPGAAPSSACGASPQTRPKAPARVRPPSPRWPHAHSHHTREATNQSIIGAHNLSATWKARFKRVLNVETNWRNKRKKQTVLKLRWYGQPHPCTVGGSGANSSNVAVR
jgi:hypothetical protein